MGITRYRYKKALDNRVKSVQQSSGNPEKGLGCGILLHVLYPALQCLFIYSFGTVSYLHPTSWFIYIMIVECFILLVYC